MIGANKSKVRRRSSIVALPVVNDPKPIPYPSANDAVETAETRSGHHIMCTMPNLMLLATTLLFTAAAVHSLNENTLIVHVPFTSGSIRHSKTKSSGFKALPEKCRGVTQPKFIAIRGERHSATNLFRQVTNRNGKFQQSCTHHNDLEKCDEYLGWKHGYLDPAKDIMDEDVILAVMVRDVFSWLVSMFYDPYNMIMLENTDQFGSFLKSSYNATCEHDIDYIKDSCTFPMEQANNLLELRTNKYRNWIDFLASPVNETRSHRWSIIHQEELVGLKNQERTTQTFFDDHCIPSRLKFKVVGKFVTKSLQPNNIAQRDILAQFTIGELQFVLDNIDVEYEKQTLGYDYYYVTDHIEQRSKGDNLYLGPPTLSDKALLQRLQNIQDNVEGRIPGRDISIIDENKKLYKARQHIIAKRMNHNSS
jgi:hypothetical protein